MDPAAVRDMEGLTAAEIFNGVSTIPWNGARGDSSAWFDIWATHYGIRMPSVAGDDAHGYDGDECQSFTMVKAASLTRNDIIHALETGGFYASQGPKFPEAFMQVRGQSSWKRRLILRKEFSISKARPMR